MKRPAFLLAAIFLYSLSLQAAEFTVTAPLDWQVAQRATWASGTILLAGQRPPGATIEWRVSGQSEFRKLPEGWRTISIDETPDAFSADIALPAGGWYQIEVRALKGGEIIGETTVGHVGVGEVFVVAGQSNSANYGEEKQANQTGLVSAFTGSGWQPAIDPQPGASGGGGSFMPPFGDAIAKRYHVPVGLVACGIGATSVREWLPKGATFPNPPSLEKRVEQLPDGRWASKGEAYEMFTTRMMQLGPQGFRAVLWHQGESDANQKDPARTLAGPLYTEYLSAIICASRRVIGWEAPWFVAQASYHRPDDQRSPEIRAAQKAVCELGLAQIGPDTDALTGKLRQKNGMGVHFSGPGLREHAARWFERVSPWLDQKLKPREIFGQ